MDQELPLPPPSSPNNNEEEEEDEEPITSYITVKPQNAYVAKMKAFWENIGQKEDLKKRQQGPPPMVNLLL